MIITLDNLQDIRNNHSDFIGTQLAQPHETPTKAHREFLAEHGATVSLLGRIATVKEVPQNVNTRGDSEAARNARNVEQSRTIST